MSDNIIKKKRGRPSKNNAENKEKKSTVIIKKNIEIFKKEKIKCPVIKVKSNIEEKGLVKNSVGKSMEESLKTKEVMLWGLNSVDDIILKLYEKDFLKSSQCQNQNLIDENSNQVLLSDSDINPNPNNPNPNNPNLNSNAKTTDTIFNPSHDYGPQDINFLNQEYVRIENELSLIKEYCEKKDELMDLQDKLADLINDFSCENNHELNDCDHNNAFDNTSNIVDNNELNELSDKEHDEIFDEIFDEKSDITSEITSSDESNKKDCQTRKKKLKPYYCIGEIPDGFREATQEEAIINKKVSWFGKYKVTRELYNLYCISGTIFIPDQNPKQLNLKILALKGKMHFYKKEHEYWKISLGSSKTTPEKIKEINEKISEIKDCYKKTLDVLNLHIQSYLKITEKSNTSNTSNKQQNNAKVEVEVEFENKKFNDKKILIK